jgi:hypothetical protein
LYLLYGGVIAETLLSPLLAAGSTAVLAGALLVILMVVRGRADSQVGPGGQTCRAEVPDAL